LLRGINVGGHNIMPMAELRTLSERLGFERITTYIQSGNLIFSTDIDDKKTIETQLSAAISSQFGFAPKLMLVSASELEACLEANPYIDITDPKKLLIFFMSDVPEVINHDKLSSLLIEGERYSLVGSCFYLHVPEGQAKSKMAVRAESILKVAMTGRNLATVKKLIEITKA